MLSRRISSAFVACLGRTFKHFILPRYHIFGLNVAHLSFPEERDQLGAEDMLFGVPCVVFQTLLHVLKVYLRKAVKGHVKARFDLVHLLTLPRLSFFLCGEPTLLCLLAFSTAVGVAIDHTPLIAVFIDRHSLTSFRCPQLNRRSKSFRGSIVCSLCPRL